MIDVRAPGQAGDLSIHRASDHILVLMRCAALMLPPTPPARSVLDLGCGAGALARSCWDLPLGRWTGVDACPAALEQARQMGRYETLQLRAVEEYGPDDQHIHAVVACSRGLSAWSSLTGLFSAVWDHLRPGGVFVFSTEELPPGPKEWRLGAKGRHAHTAAYLEASAASAGFTVPNTYLTPLFNDEGQPVMSRVTMLRRSAAARVRQLPS